MTERKCPRLSCQGTPEGVCGGAEEIRSQAATGFTNLGFSEERKRQNWQEFIEKRREYSKDCDYPSQLTEAIGNTEPPYSEDSG